MHACMQQANVLVASAGLNLKGGDTCFSIHDQHQFMCIFLGGEVGKISQMGYYRAARLLCLSMKMKEN